jgi:hypothetical protein
MLTLQKEPAAAPAYDPQQKKSSAPSLRCAHFSGYGSPLQSLNESKETKRTKKNEAWMVTVLQARAPPSHLLLCIPNYPLVHFFRMSLVLIHSPFHKSSNAGQLQESKEPAFPSWAPEEYPDSLRISPLARLYFCRRQRGVGAM